MKKKERSRPRLLTVRLTTEEALELAAYAADRCLNISALARKLLFEEIRRKPPCGGVGA